MGKLNLKRTSESDFSGRNQLTSVLLAVAMLLVSLTTSCDKDKVGTLPQASTDEVSGIMDIQAVGGGKVVADGGSKIVAMGLCWTSTGEEPTVEDDFVAAGKYTHNGIEANEWQFQATITNLIPKTAYKVRAYVANEAGVAYGETKSFTTKAGKTFHTLTPDMLFTFTQEIWEGPKESLVDNNYTTFWHSAWSNDPGAEVHPLPHFIQITFSEPKGIGGIQYWHRSPSGSGGRPNKFDIQTSTNGTDWSTVWTSANSLPTNILPPNANTLGFDKNYTSKYFRIRILATPNMTTFTYLSELKVFHDGLLD
jgi:hypothetical protein